MFHRTLCVNNVTLLNANGPIGHSLRIKGKQIVAIDAPPNKRDYVIDGQGGLLIPGLINAHDHLELNTFKRLKYRDRYTHSLQWIEDIEARFNTDPDLTEPRKQPLVDRLLVGGIKNLLSGVTTVCHHNPFHKPLRRHYPIRVVKNYGFNHSIFRGNDLLRSYQKTKSTHPWIIHLAEGVDTVAETEFEQLERLGVLGQNTVLVHGVGLTKTQRQTLLKQGGGLIWCPGSNYFLFEQTAKVQELAQAGKVALGSDSRLSGEFDLLSELRVAHMSNQLSPQQLFKTVTTHAAHVLKLKKKGVGQIVIGGSADLVLLPSLPIRDPFECILDLDRSRVMLVMLEGKPVVGSVHMRSVFETAGIRYEQILVDNVDKIMSQKLMQQLRKLSVGEPGVIVQ